MLRFAGYLLTSALFLKLQIWSGKEVGKTSASMSSPKAEEVVTVDVSQAKSLIESGHQYLDVR